MWTLPNLLSSFRILVIPVLVYLLTYTDPFAALLAALLFIIASLTDYLDGYFARRNGSVSNLGKILDPLADKLMIISVLIMLAAMDRVGEPNAPAWMVVIIVAREIAVTVIRCIALTDGIVMQAETLGKYKFVLQAFAVSGLLIHYRYWGIDFYVVGTYFLALATLIAVWSGVNYHFQFFRLLQTRADHA